MSPSKAGAGTDDAIKDAKKAPESTVEGKEAAKAEEKLRELTRKASVGRTELEKFDQDTSKGHLPDLSLEGKKKPAKPAEKGEDLLPDASTQHGNLRLQEVTNKDGSVTSYDANGRISQVKLSNGELRQFERDEDGKVTKIKESNGTEWISQDGRSFVMNGSGARVEGALCIGADGSYSFKSEGRGEVRRNADGSVSVLDQGRQELSRSYNDGSAVALNEKGQVADTTDAAGKRRSFGYDAEGRLNKIVEPDGAVWESSDGKSWRKHGSREVRNGEVAVHPDGSYSVTNARGERHLFKLDGSQVSTNERGQVVSVTDRSGKQRSFQYNEAGALSGLREPDGAVWTSSDGKTWTKKDGKSTWEGTISVDGDGTYREVAKSGQEKVKRTDGWTEVKDGTGSARFERENADGSRVTKNARGQVTEIKDARGDSRKFAYDQNGVMTRMVEPSGKVWTSQDGKAWSADGSDEKRTFEPEAREDGLYREKLDRQRVRAYKPDGAAVTADERGRVLEVTAANGKTRSFEYGTDGKVSKITEPSGTVWTSTDGKNWKANGKDSTWTGTVTVRPDGTYEEVSESTGKKTVRSTDGKSVVWDKNGKPVSVESTDGERSALSYDDAGKFKGAEVARPDGSSLVVNEKNQVTRTKDAAGALREFEYGADGKVNKVKGPDGTWTTSDGVNWTSETGRTWKGSVFVAADGSYNYMDASGKELTSKQLDGKTVVRDRSGASRVVDPSGRVTETTNARGETRKFEYDGNGQLSKIHETDGVVWETKDGQNWSKDGGKTISWRGKCRVEADGTLFEEASNGNRVWKKPDGARVEVNYAEMEAACKAINDATYWSITEGGTDEAKFQAALEGKTVAQRQMMDEIYQRQYGKTIEQEARDEMEGHDLEKTLALLKKGDGADNAGTIRVALVERGQWMEGRSDSECERVVRDTLETMSAAEIAETDRQYRERYGQSLHDAVMSNPSLSEKSKEACAIYLKGHDQRTAQDVIFLANRACENGDATMFQEAMRRAPREARDHFATTEGQQKMKDAFEGHWYNALTFGLTGNVTDTELTHVQDYAQYGKLSVATQVKDNTSWLGDNEQAIEQALFKMTDQERQDYANGRKLAGGEQLATDLSAADRERALTYYNSVSTALKGAAGKWFSSDSVDNEFAKWEDMIMVRGGSLVSRLADHRGHIYDSSMHDVITSIEDMGKEDWDRLKQDPQYRGKLEAVLKTYLNDDELKRCMGIIDEKAKAETFEASQQNRRPILDAIEDNIRWYNNDEANIYRSIEHMTQAEQEAYRSNTDGFKDRLDAKLRQCLDADEQKVAFGLLAKVERGEKPEMSIMDKLNLQASYMDSDEAQVIRDIQEAFKKDPALRERINNPQSDADREFAAQFKDAARRAMGGRDYERYARPLIETGHLSIELQMELSRGIFDDDEQGSYGDVQNATDAEKQRILTDSAFQERVLGHLSSEERKIALASMSQGEMRPEDKLRSYMVGAGTSEDEIKQVFAEIRNREQYRSQGVPEDQIDAAIRERLDTVKREYARKYGEDLSATLIDELGGKDLREVERQLHVRSAREEFLFAQEQASESRSGFGSGLVDAIWDGTGFQMDDDRNALARAMVMEPEKVSEYADQLYKSIDMHSESKEAMADAIVDTTIAAAAVAGAFFTGGVSLSLLAYTGLAGAAFKVGAKGAIMGGDYDWGSTQVLLDGGTGFIDGATSLWGGNMLAVGRRAGVKAAQETIEAGGKAFLREGTEAAFKKEAAELVSKALLSKAKGVSDDAIREVVEKYAKEGGSEALEGMLKRSLAEAVETESKQWLKHIATEVADNALAGSLGAGASGMVRAGFMADSFDEFVQITAMSAGFGAAGGAAFTVALRPVGWGATKAWTAGRKVFGRGGADAVENVVDNTASRTMTRAGHEQPVSPRADATGHGDATPEVRARESSRPTDRASVREIAEAKSPPSDKARAQSNDFAVKHELTGRIEDGWTNSGAGRFVSADGSFSAPRAAMVVDRQNDVVLQRTIAEAREHMAQFKNLSPERQAEELAKYVREKLTPKVDLPGHQAQKLLDDMYTSFMTENAGKRIMLGEFIDRQMGGCAQQACLLKVLADDLLPGAEVALVRGNGVNGGDAINHMWTTIRFRKGEPELVYDPRQGVFGDPYAAHAGRYKPGSEMPKDPRMGLSPDAPGDLRPGQAVDLENSPGWKVERVDGDNITVRHDGVKSVTRGDLQTLIADNPGMDLSVGRTVKLRRPDGSLDDGWEIRYIDKENGDLIMYKKDAVQMTVRRGELYRSAPELSGGFEQLKARSAESFEAAMSKTGANKGQVEASTRAFREALEGVPPERLPAIADSIAALKPEELADRASFLRHLGELKKKTGKDIPVDVEMLLHPNLRAADLQAYRVLADKLSKVDGWTHLPAGELPRLEQQIRQRMDEFNALKYGALDTPAGRGQLDQSMAKFQEVDRVLTALERADGTRAPKLKDEQVKVVADLLKTNFDRPDIPIAFDRVLDPKAQPRALQMYRDLIDHSTQIRRPSSAAAGAEYEFDASVAVQKSLKDSKLQGENWVFVPSAHNSPADGVGIDGALINLDTNELVPVDFANSVSRLQGKVADGKGMWALHIPQSRIGVHRPGVPPQAENPAMVRRALEDFIGGRQLSGVAAPPRFKLDDFGSVVGRAETGKPGFPSFRAVSAQAEADQLRALTSEAELRKLFDDLHGVSPRSAGMDHLLDRTRSAIAQRNAEAGLSDRILPRLRDAVDVRSLDFDSGVVKTPSMSKGADLVSLPGNPPRYAHYVEFPFDKTLHTAGSLNIPGGRPWRFGTDITSVRVYEDGRVVGIGVMRNGNPATVEIGHVKDWGEAMARHKASRNVSPERASSVVDDLFGHMDRIDMQQIEIEPGKVVPFNPADAAHLEAFYKKYPGLRVLGEAVTQADLVMKNATDGRTAANTVARVMRDARARFPDNPDKYPSDQEMLKIWTRLRRDDPSASFDDVVKSFELDAAMPPVKQADAVQFRRYSREGQEVFEDGGFEYAVGEFLGAKGSPKAYADLLERINKEGFEKVIALPPPGSSAYEADRFVFRQVLTAIAKKMSSDDNAVQAYVQRRMAELFPD